MLFSGLKCKDVINIKDCKCLGRVCDLEFEDCSGHIHAIVVSGKNRLNALFFGDPDIVIPFCDIIKIGPDIILVEIGKGGRRH